MDPCSARRAAWPEKRERRPRAVRGRAAEVLEGGLMASIAEEAGRASAEAAERLFVDVFSQVLLSEKSAPFFRVSSRKFFGFRRGHAASFLTCPA